MAIREIVLYPDPVLAVKCPEVAEVTDEIRTLVDDMIATMYDAPGIGLAAPQIGVEKRITVIDVSPPDEERNIHVFINPVIKSKSGSVSWEEGCLSFPGVYEKVPRAAEVVVEALDRDGNPYTVEADELLAICLQHEIDHLDGVMFIDHLSRLKRRVALKKYKRHLEGLEADAKEKAGKDESPA